MANNRFVRGLGIWATAGLLGVLAFNEIRDLKNQRVEDNTKIINNTTKQDDDLRSDFSIQFVQDSKPEFNQESGSLSKTAEYISNFEGLRLRVYDPNPKDGKSEPTIGVGHYLDRGNSRETFLRVLPEVNYDRIYSGEDSLTKNQALKLFNNDLPVYVERAKKLIPEFDKLPTRLQDALVDMAYRGDLGGSPKMRKLLNDGKFREAADEYINNNEYRNAKIKGMTGVKTRMDSNRSRILEYSNSLDSLPN